MAADPTYPNVVQLRQDGSAHVPSGQRLTIEAGGELYMGAVAISEIGDLSLPDVTATAAEINTLDITAAGTVEASKAVVVDANKDASAFRNLGAVNVDAGSSGAAGSVDVFPSTGNKGKVAITKADNSADDTTSVVFGAHAAARTLTVPDPLANADFLLGQQAAVARTATADGLTTGTIADGGRFQFVQVTCDSADKIIVLPTPTPGTEIVLNNGATGYELRSSSPTTIAINGGTGAAAESAIPANSTVRALCISATAWKAYFLDADSDVAKVEAAAT